MSRTPRRPVDSARLLTTLRAFDRGVLTWRPRRGSALRRLDARYASRGPLAVLRDVPQVGGFVLAAIVAGGGVIAADRHHSSARAHPHIFTVAPTPGVAGPSTTAGLDENPVVASPALVGPTPGSSVAAYVSSRRSALSAATETGSPLAAVISFTHYLRPSEIRSAVPGVQLVRVLVHVPVAGRPTPSATIPAGSLLLALSRAVTGLRREADDAQNQAATIDLSRTPGLRPDKLEFEAEAASLRHQADVYVHGPSVYAVLVEAPVPVLHTLAASPVVRVVDLAEPGVPATALQPVGLLPEDTATVSEPPIDDRAFPSATPRP